jgi:hypothetical protein
MKIKWQGEKLDDFTVRFKVIGGWLVRVIDIYEESCALTQNFIPDADHKWEIDTEELT